MRIAIVHWTRRKVGGVETYLSRVIPELHRAGHDVAFCSESNEPLEREQICLPQDAPSWSVAEMGTQGSLEALRGWKPDVIYSHKVENLKLEADVLQIAPSVYFAHDYRGMCISGTKTFKLPTTKPCGRRFDERCLAHYFPHRCGGLNPLTMIKLYRLESKRLELLHRYNAIVTQSEHMFSELIKQGFSAQHIHSFLRYTQETDRSDGTDGESNLSDLLFTYAPDCEKSPPEMRERSYWHLLFSGRMELLKGGQVFLDALPKVAATLKKPLRITFAGDGRARGSWEREAARLQDEHESLEIEFMGWADRSRIDALLEECDLLVVPSLWPEPFGLVGPEAGLKGVPVAAFDVGGISDWLSDGINGYLAPGDPPTSEGLSNAIIRCLGDPRVYASLRRRAVKLAERFNINRHLASLLEVFENVTQHS